MEDQYTELSGFLCTMQKMTKLLSARIETRFATIQDYFMAMYATMCGVKINDSIKLTVAGEMRERWPGAVLFDLVTCDFHANMRYTEQCRARSCSLFVAHEAA